MPIIRRGPSPLTISTLLLLAACGNATEPQAPSPALEIATPSVLQGDPPQATISGLKPGQTVNVRLERNRGRRELRLFRSEADFVATSKREIEVFRQAPLEPPYGDYAPSDLFSSMRAVEEPAVEGRSTRVIVLRADLDGDGVYDLVDQLTLMAEREGLVTDTGPEALPGSFLTKPSGEGPFPVIIAMGGSEGNDSSARSFAQSWASRGYAVFGLPYYSPAWGDQPQQIPELPRAFANIPLDQLETARDWICAEADLQCDKIGLLGVSKGAEMALAGASRIEGFAAVAAIVPSDVIWEGWGAGETVSSFSWRGEPLPFVPYLGMDEHFAKLRRGEESMIRTPHDDGRAANPEAADRAAIDVTAIDEPVFLIGGDADEVWASGPMAATIKDKRDQAGLTTVAITSADAGHSLSGNAYVPLREAEARVRRESFPALIIFFEAYLKAS